MNSDTSGRPPDEEPKETKPDVRNIIESVCLIDDEDDAEEAVNAFHHMTRKKLLPFTGVEIQEEFKFLKAIKQFKMVLEEKVEVLTSRQNLKEFLYKYLVFFASNYSRIAVLYQEQYLDVMEDILLFYCDVIKEFFRDQKRKDKKMNVVQEARRIKILFRDCLLTRMDRILHVLLKVRLAPEIEECRMFWGDVYMYFLTKVRYLYSDDDILRGFVAFQKFKTIRAKSEAAMIDQLMYSVYTKTTAELRRIPCLGEMMDRMKGDRLYTVWDMVTRYMSYYYQAKSGRAERCFEMEDFDEDTEDSRANDLRRLDLSSRSPVRTMPARRRGLRKTVLDLADDPQNQFDECNVEFSLFGEDIDKQEAPDDAVIVVCDDLKTVITIDDDDDEVEEERPAQIQPPKSPPPREAPSPEKVLRAVAQVAAPPPGEPSLVPVPSPEKLNISPSKTRRQVKRVDNSLRITIISFVPSERSAEDASTVVHNVNNLSENVDLQQVAPPCTPSSRLTLDVNKESERVEDRQQIQSTVIAKEKDTDEKMEEGDGAASEAPTTHLNQSQYNQPMETEEVPNIMPIDQSASQKELSSGSDEGIIHVYSPDVSNSSTWSANPMNPAERIGVLPSSKIPSDLEDSPEKPMTPPSTAERLGVLPSSKIPSDLEDSPEKPVTPPLTARRVGVLPSSRIPSDLESSPEKPMTPPLTAKRIGVLPSSKIPSDLEDSPEKPMTPPLTARQIGVLPSSRIPNDLEDSPGKVKIAPIDIAAHQRDLARIIQQANELKLRQQRRIKLALEMREKQQESLRRDQSLIHSADFVWFLRARASVTTAKSEDQSNHRNNGHKATEKRKYRDFSPDTDEAIPRKKIVQQSSAIEVAPKVEDACANEALQKPLLPPKKRKLTEDEELAIYIQKFKEEKERRAKPEENISYPAQRQMSIADLQRDLRS